MKLLKEFDLKISELINKELHRQTYGLQLIPSENYVSKRVLEAEASIFSNKYAEGYPGKKWYSGCVNASLVEKIAIQRAQKLFGAEHVNVQPHSGSQANMAVYFAVLEPQDTILSLDLTCGGHLTHGNPVNFSGRYYKVIHYGVGGNTHLINFKEVKKLAHQYRPKMIITGASSYPRIIDFKYFREIADEVSAYLMVDIAHIAGLIIAGLHPNPIPYADFVTSSTHKTLRGPRGGIIMCKKIFAEKIDRAIFPGIQGGPAVNLIAAKAVAFKEALTPEFIQYQKQIVKNAKILAEELNKKLGFDLLTGGTDTHLLVIDLTSKKISGKEASYLLEKANIFVNKNVIPYDSQSSFITSGIRLGTPAVTTLGMREKEMQLIAQLIAQVLLNKENKKIRIEVKEEVKKLCSRFKFYD